MNLGAPVAIACWGGIVGLVGYGLSYDIRHWWQSDAGWPERLRWRLDERRARRGLRLEDFDRMPAFNGWDAHTRAMKQAVDEWLIVQLDKQFEMPCAPNPRLLWVSGDHERMLGERKDWP